jgi:hypothetical protein
MNYRGEVKTANERIRAAKKERKIGLEELRDGCVIAQQKVKKRCTDSRKAIRKKARDIEAQQKDLKRREREDYSLRAGSVRKQRTMSRAENDSLAEHNIPPELLEIWREDRKRYSYDKEPDMRAEQFLEWAEAHEDDITARLQKKLEQDWPDLAYARDFGEHQEEQEAVPF